jgi:hypothetical protein
VQTELAENSAVLGKTPELPIPSEPPISDTPFNFSEDVNRANDGEK